MLCTDGRLLVHQQTHEDHPDFSLWQSLLPQFREAGLEVLPLEAPHTLKDNRDWVDYSYINHYVCNGAVICPAFNDPRDVRRENGLRTPIRVRRSDARCQRRSSRWAAAFTALRSNSRAKRDKSSILRAPLHQR